MSTELSTIPDNIQVPAHLQSAPVSNDLEVTESFLPRVVAKDGHFVIRKDGEDKHLPLGQPINVVILAASPLGKGVTKQFYAGAFTDDKSEPDCHSANGVVPDAGCPAPQAESCAVCPKNAWGSGTDAQGNPTKGKACSDRKELIVIPNTQLASGAYSMSVPPKSLKPLSIYGRELAKHNIPMVGVVTSIGFDPEDPKTLKFSFGSFLNENDAAITMELAASSEVQDHVVDPAAITNTAPPETAPVTAAEVVAHEATVAPEPTPEPTPAAADPFQAHTPTAPHQEPEQVGQDLDADGVPWDQDLHASTKTKTKDGRWKKKRGAAPAAEPTTEPTPEIDQGQVAGELDSILNGW